jgi:hypothetical protein
MHQLLQSTARRGRHSPRGRRGPLAAFALALAAGVLVSGPTLAAQAPWSSSSASCDYVTDSSGERVLNFITVSPPDLYADSGTQQVGWGFVVRRSTNWDVGPWKVTFRSHIQKADATVNQPGAFSAKGVLVHVPNVEDKSAIRYHVTLKMLWYASDGTVSRRITHRFNSIGWFFHDHHKGTGDYCPASLDTGP